jgi:hypothetical protein
MFMYKSSGYYFCTLKFKTQKLWQKIKKNRG